MASLEDAVAAIDESFGANIKYNILFIPLNFILNQDEYWRKFC